MEAKLIPDWDEFELRYGKGGSQPDGIIYRPSGSLAPAYEESPEEKKRKRAEQKRREALRTAELKRRRRQVTWKRIKQSLVFLAVVSLVTVVVGVYLARQNEINALNFEATKTESSIREVQQKTKQLEQEIQELVDENEMRDVAAESLGMQDPALDQTQEVFFPMGDVLSGGKTEQMDPLNKENIASAKDNLTEYFAS